MEKIIITMRYDIVAIDGGAKRVYRASSQAAGVFLLALLIQPREERRFFRARTRFVTRKEQ